MTYVYTHYVISLTLFEASAQAMEASSSSQSRNAKTAVLQNLLTDNGAKPTSDTTDNDADSAAKPAGTSLDDRHSAAKTVETVTLRVVSALSAEHMFGPLRIQRTEKVSWLIRQLQHLSFSDNPHRIGKQIQLQNQKIIKSQNANIKNPKSQNPKSKIPHNKCLRI